MNRDLSADQEYILKQIAALAAEHKPDAVVIAGDIYDRPVPSAEAVDLFDKFVTDLTETLPDSAVMMISGNHDSGDDRGCLRSSQFLSASVCQTVHGQTDCRRG